MRQGKAKSDSLVIRDALPEELDAVSRLLRAAFQQYADSIPGEAWQFYLQDIVDVRGRLVESGLIVARLGGRLAGTISLYLNPAKSSEGGWPEGWAALRLLGVHPVYRGRGIGRALMEECFQRCRSAGIAQVGLHTTAIMDVARRMYEKMGFVRVPEYDFHPRPGVVIMAYRLDLV
jgi:GNAT superfamily N-acetyltransferase